MTKSTGLKWLKMFRPSLTHMVAILLYGVEDGSHEMVGVSFQESRLLRDTDNIQQKLNRYLEPQIHGVRSKGYRFDGNRIVCVWVPQSKGLTHLISKDGEFKHTSGKTKTVLHKGTFYIRRSGGNHLGDARDLDALIERRLEQYQDALMDKVARVIQAPSESEVLITTAADGDDSAERFVLTHDENATPVVGVTFTKPPETPEQEILGWNALTTHKPGLLPPAEQIWKWYRQREGLHLDGSTLLALFKTSLRLGAPAYFWIRELKAGDIQKALLDAVRERTDNLHVSDMLEAAAFLGKGPYKEALAALGSYRDKVVTAKQSYPSAGPRSLRTRLRKSRNISEASFRNSILRKLNDISDVEGKEPSTQKRWEAQKCDIYLYARDDRYK